MNFTFFYPFATRVWALVLAISKPSTSISTILSLFFQELRRVTALPPTCVSSTSLFPWVLWNLWTTQDGVSKFEVGPPLNLPHVIPPSPLRCYVDAACDKDSENSGLGWVIKDVSDSLVCHKSLYCCFLASALIAESLAVKAALSDAFMSGITELDVYPYSKNLVSYLTDNGTSIKLQGVLYDTSVLSRSFTAICFSFFPCCNNTLADSVAKLVLLSLQMAPPVME
ncbi:unnamed protein product [Thlaspi arvense]|uniref:RNase H type-1 domain-containing protein n=1 Tax=Thlaspi arvense TaxID=13288 RepID=A0AAU9SK62_THLAR|nr:unnamed protein product [Thlaspi arvense]